MSFSLRITPPDEGLILWTISPFQGWSARVQSVNPVHQQWKRFMSCVPAAVDELDGGDAGLAANAVATRGSRSYGLSPTFRGDRGPHGLSPHTFNNSTSMAQPGEIAVLR